MQSYCEKMAYLAGFFDGEGSISLMMDQRRRKFGWRPCQHVQITNTVPELLEDYQRMFGGKIIVKKPPACTLGKKPLAVKPQWKWYCYGSNARQFLTAIYPFLRHEEKKCKAVQALMFDEDDGYLKKKSLEPQWYFPNTSLAFDGFLMTHRGTIGQPLS